MLEDGETEGPVRLVDTKNSHSQQQHLISANFNATEGVRDVGVTITTTSTTTTTTSTNTANRGLSYTNGHATGVEKAGDDALSSEDEDIPLGKLKRESLNVSLRQKQQVLSCEVARHVGTKCEGDVNDYILCNNRPVDTNHLNNVVDDDPAKTNNVEQVSKVSEINLEQPTTPSTYLNEHSNEHENAGASITSPTVHDEQHQQQTTNNGSFHDGAIPATNDTLQQQQSKNKYGCHECGKVFPKSAALARHFNRTHGVQGTHNIHPI